MCFFLFKSQYVSTSKLCVSIDVPLFLVQILHVQSEKLANTLSNIHTIGDAITMRVFWSLNTYASIFFSAGSTRSLPIAVELTSFWTTEKKKSSYFIDRNAGGLASVQSWAAGLTNTFLHGRKKLAMVMRSTSPTTALCIKLLNWSLLAIWSNMHTTKHVWISFRGVSLDISLHTLWTKVN